MSYLTHPLFRPYALGPYLLPNRFVMAPMTRNRALPTGVPTPLMAEYYAQRASAGLIVAEAAAPAADGQTYPNIAGIFNESQREGWRLVVESLVAAGGRAFLQLQHGGRIGHPSTNGETPMAPTALALPTSIHTPKGKEASVIPREMTLQDIQQTIINFAEGAKRAVHAGFLGVELHAANGFLLHQFLAPNTNQRNDEYGGTPARRARFVIEVVDAVVAAVGSERVGVRISPHNPTNGIIESAADVDGLYPLLAKELAKRSLSYLHVAFADPTAAVWAKLRSNWSTTLIANPTHHGRFPEDGGLDAAVKVHAAGADLVSIGRPFLANPDLVQRYIQGAAINQPLPARYMYVGGAEGYTDYPLSGAEV
ncbi:alkene reductase [Paenarthrobacter sp. NPDC057981]|uniref:alkene reductase n=1 Tax=Paenarthrobacter sp. NPDC057981 TaxID=3346297 RepID=UPI0036D88FAD